MGGERGAKELEPPYIGCYGIHQWSEDFQGLHDGGDIVNAEDVGSSSDASSNAGEGAGVAFVRIGEVEDIPDDGFARNGQQDGAIEAMEFFEVAVNSEVVVALFGEVDARIEDDLVGVESGGDGELNFFFEEAVEFRHDVGPADMGVGDFGLPDAVHDEQGGPVLGAEFGIAGIGQGGDVVEDVAAVGKDLFDDFGAPGVDGKQGWRSR